MMNKLKELATKLSTRRLIYDDGSAAGKRAGLLHDYVRTTASPTEAGAAAVLSCAAGSIIVSRSVEHLEKILLDNLLMVRSGDITSDDPEIIKRYVWKLIGVGAGQIMNVSSPVVTPCLEEAFELAETHGLISAAKVSCNFLAMRTVSPHLDKAKHLYYRDKSIYYESLFLDYELIRLFLREIDHNAKCQTKPAENFEQMKQLRAQTLQALERYKHPKLDLAFRYLTLRISYSEEHHLQTIALVKEAIEWAESGPAYLKKEVIGFVLFLSQTYLVADDFVNGYQYLNDLFRDASLPRPAREKLLETICLLSLRTGRYTEAITHFDELEQWNKVTDQSGALLFGAYLWLLGQSNFISDEHKSSRRWMNHKSIRAVFPDHKLRGDKQVLNHYHIVSIVFCISKKKYSLAKRSFDALSRPRRSEYLRYKAFYKMLEAMFTQGLHRIAVERHTKSLAKQLGQLPATPELITEYVEVVPFEVLWEMITGLLPSKRIKFK